MRKKLNAIFLAMMMVLIFSACGVRLTEDIVEPEGREETNPDFSEAVDFLGNGKVVFQKKESAVETEEPAEETITAPEPTTQEVTTQEKTTKEETTPEQTTQEPTTEEITTEEITTQETTTQEPTTEEVTTQEITTQEVTTTEPTTEEVTTEPETEPPAPVKSSNKILRSVYVNGSKLERPYGKIDVASPTAVIKAYTVDDAATLQGNGEYDLVEGENKIELQITAEDGSTGKCALTINYIPLAPTHRELIQPQMDMYSRLLATFEKGAGNNRLRRIEVNGQRISLKDRKLTVGTDTEEVEVSAVASSSGTKIEGTGTVKLSEGLNKVNITVTARDGSKRTYTIEITREEKEKPTEAEQPPAYDYGYDYGYEYYYYEPEPDFPADVGVIIIG